MLRITEKFICLSVKTVLKKDVTYEQEKKFWLEMDSYHGTCNDFCEIISSLEGFDFFMWIFLNTVPAWEQVELSCAQLNKRTNIDDNAFVSGQYFLKSLIKRWNSILKNGKVSYTMRDGILCFSKPDLKSNS